MSIINICKLNNIGRIHQRGPVIYSYIEQQRLHMSLSRSLPLNFISCAELLIRGNFFKRKKQTRETFTRYIVLAYRNPIGEKLRKQNRFIEFKRLERIGYQVSKPIFYKRVKEVHWHAPTTHIEQRKEEWRAWYEENLLKNFSKL